MAKERRTADELREQIDHGRTGDKVDFEDPAAAPLGTDAEAGGAPPTPDQVEQAWTHEVDRRPDDRTAGRPDRTIPPRQFMEKRSGNGLLWVIVILAVLLVIALLFWG